MNKQQYLEKCLADFRHDFGEGYPKWNNPDKESWTREKVEMIEHFLQSKLSECWDVAGEEGEKELDRALEERDNTEEWADQLANDISAVTGIDIGEHSNMNNPWANALEALHTYFDSLTSKQEEEK